MADSRVKVFARFRPTKKLCPFLDIQVNSISVAPKSTGEEERFSKAVGVPYDFKFAKVFDGSASQEDLFEAVSKPTVSRFLDGYNGTVFAYGQTGSGKTFTVEGSARRYRERGMIPRTISHVFSSLEDRQRDDEEWKVEVSYMEIYQDVGYDLLNPGAQGASMMVKLPKVRVVDSCQRGVVVRNLSLHLAANEEVAQGLLFQGSANRKVAETSMNMQSSRSHAIFTVVLTVKSPQPDVLIRSKLNLVDLAGSERVAKTRADGRVLNEAKYINLSLHHLEHVIVALHQQTRPKPTATDRLVRSSGSSPLTSPPAGGSRGGCRGDSPSNVRREANGVSLSSTRQRPGTRTHVPYRNCLLTMVLKDSLGGNCFTSMVATLSGEEGNLGETVSTCRFAQRVSCIANVVRRNEEVDDKVMIKRLKKRIAELEAEVSLLKQGIINTTNTSQQHQKQQQQHHQHNHQQHQNHHHHQQQRHQHHQVNGSHPYDHDHGPAPLPSAPPLSPEGRKHCHQILYSYLHGRLDDPVQAGVDDAAKVEECLKVMKGIVLHALGVEKQGGKGKMAAPRAPSSTSTAGALHPHKRPPQDLPPAHGGLVPSTSPTPDSRISSGFGSIGGEGRGSREITPMAHDGHVTSSHKGHTVPFRSRDGQVAAHRAHTSQSTPVGNGRKQEVELRKSLTVDRKRESSHRKSPGSSQNGRHEDGMEQLAIAQSEEEKRRLQLHVQQLQIRVKQEEIKSDLGLVGEQLARQHCRIVALQQHGGGRGPGAGGEEAEEQLCQERLAEQQLRVKQAKLHQHLTHIEHSLKVHNMVGTPGASRDTESPQNPSGNSSLQRQLVVAVTQHSRHQSKIDEQIEELRKSQVEKSLELREAATRRKLLAMKQQFSSDVTFSALSTPLSAPSTAPHLYRQDPGASTAPHLYRQDPGASTAPHLYRQDPGSSTAHHPAQPHSVLEKNAGVRLKEKGLVTAADGGGGIGQDHPSFGERTAFTRINSTAAERHSTSKSQHDSGHLNTASAGPVIPSATTIRDGPTVSLGSPRRHSRHHTTASTTASREGVAVPAPTLGTTAGSGRESRPAPPTHSTTTPTHQSTRNPSTVDTPPQRASQSGLAVLMERLQVTSPPTGERGKVPYAYPPSDRADKSESVSTSSAVITSPVIDTTAATPSGQVPRPPVIRASQVPRPPVSIPEVSREGQYMSQGQRQQARVNRIRRAMAAATIIQRAWRDYRGGARGGARGGWELDHR